MTTKSESIDKFLEKLSYAAFNQSRKQSITNGVCVSCGTPAVKFRDDLSRREFQISGLCQSCQDYCFKT